MNINEFWIIVFDKLDILNQIDKDNFFRLSRSDCSLILNNKVNLRIEDYFVFETYESLPQIFKENNLVIIQTYKSNFSICKVENYFKLPVFDFEPLPLKQELSVFNNDEFIENKVSFILELFNNNILDDLIVSRDESELQIVNIHSYKSKFSELSFSNIKYREYQKQVSIKISNVKVFYDVILEDDMNFYVFIVIDKKISTFNLSSLYLNLLNIRKHFDKDVVFVLITRNIPTVSLFEIVFNNKDDIYSYEVINELIFKIRDLEHTESRDLESLIYSENKIESIPFPQANDLEKIIKYCDLIYNNKKDLRTLINELGVTTRQVTYYKNSALFLGLTRIKNGNVFLDSGLYKHYTSEDKTGKIKYIIESIKKNKYISVLYELHSVNKLDLNEFKKILSDDFKMSHKTAERRFSTIRSWFKKIDSINDESYRAILINIEDQLESIIKNILELKGITHMNFYELKEALMEYAEVDVDLAGFKKQIKKSEIFFHEDLFRVFATKKDFYKYIEGAGN